MTGKAICPEDGTALAVYGLDPIMGDTRLEDVMVEHVFKRHVTLQPVVVAKTLKSPEQRVLGDSGDWDTVEAVLPQAGDGSWRNEVPLTPGAFLQAMRQWKLEGIPHTAALPQPSRGEELSSLDPSST